MVPDIYTREKLALEHRQTLLREAERERLLAMAVSPTHTSHALQHLVGRLGMYLIALGTSLKRFEERKQPWRMHPHLHHTGGPGKREQEYLCRSGTSQHHAPHGVLLSADCCHASPCWQ